MLTSAALLQSESVHQLGLQAAMYTWNFQAEFTLTANVCNISSFFLPNNAFRDAS